jgi:SAM-dependent methyltransferase
MAANDDFPPGFFDRQDPTPDDRFYQPDRFVTHIDDGAIDAVGGLYAELGVEGEVLDLMSSWVSHFRVTPRRLVVLGMNERELAANGQAAALVVHDLNVDPTLPFADESFDDATCCVSVDYLIRPVEVFAEVARVLRPSGRFVVTFSNRCFPNKVIRGWAMAMPAGCLEIVGRYFRLSNGFEEPTAHRRMPLTGFGDPLWGVWATRAERG